MVEFLLLRTLEDSPPFVYIVEAKQSSPRPETQPNFSEFINEIRDKLANALTLGVASILKRHPAADAELSESFKALDLGVTGFRLVLIINGHQKAWLQPLQDALRSAFARDGTDMGARSQRCRGDQPRDAKRFNLFSAP